MGKPMRYNTGKKQVIMMCQHLETQTLKNGTDYYVQVRVRNQVQRVLVRGFPAIVCVAPTCLAILADLDWLVAVEDALVQRVLQGGTVAPIVVFADLQLAQPARLCA